MNYTGRDQFQGILDAARGHVMECRSGDYGVLTERDTYNLALLLTLLRSVYKYKGGD